MGELVSDSMLHGNCDTISGPGSNQDHIGGPTTNLVRSAHIVACGPAVPSWSPAILYRGQWSVCNFKSGANTIRGRINYSSRHDRRRYFSVGSQICCTYQNWRLYIVAALNIEYFVVSSNSHRVLLLVWFRFSKKPSQNHQFRQHIGTANLIMKIKGNVSFWIQNIMTLYFITGWYDILHVAFVVRDASLRQGSFPLVWSLFHKVRYNKHWLNI